ncbi:hypothetical protein [Dokdonella soli]
MTVVLPVEADASDQDNWLRLGLMDLIAARLRAAGLTVLPSDNTVRLIPAGAARDAAIVAARALHSERRQFARGSPAYENLAQSRTHIYTRVLPH